MADSNEKKVLIDIQIDAADALKKYTSLKTEAEKLKKTQKELDQSTEDGRLEFELLGQQVKALNKEAETYQREIQNNIKLVNEEEGSLQQMKAELALMTAEYNSLSEAKRKGAEGQALIKSINETTTAIKQGEEAIQDYRRTVGNYENAIKSALGTGIPFVDNIVQTATSSKGLKGGFDAAKTGVVGFTKAALAFIATPVGMVILAIATAIAIVVGAFKLLSEAFKRNEDNSTKLNIVMAKLSGIFSGLLKILEPVASFLVDVLIKAFDTLASVAEKALEVVAKGLSFFGFDKAAESVRKFNNTLIETSKAAGELAKKEAELVKMEREAAKIQKEYQKEAEKLRQIRDDTTRSIGDRIKANDELGEVLKKQMDEELRIAQTALEVANLRIQVEGETTKNLDEQAAALTRIADIQERITGRESGQLKALNSLRKEAADEAFESFSKTLEAKEKFDIAMIQDEQGFQSEDFAIRQAYAYKIFNIQQDAELNRLKLQLKYGKIRQSDFDKECQILLATQKQFSTEQLKAAQQYQADIRKTLFELLDFDLDNQILEIENKYNEAVKQLGEIELPVLLPGMDEEVYAKELARAEQLMLERAFLEVELEKQKEKEITEVRRQSAEKRVTEMESVIRNEYKNDLAKYADNETEKLRILVAQQKKIIEEKKKAGIVAYEDEATLRGLQASQNQLHLNMELMQANLTAKQRYDMVKAMLEAEQKLYEGNALKQLEISRELIENERELLAERTKSFEEYSGATMELMAGLNNFISELGNAELQKYLEGNTRKKDALKERLDKGLIGQKEYDKKIKELDKEAEKQKAEVARKQAIREKTMGAFQIAINTAMGIAKTIGTIGMPLAIPFIALAAAAGALQLAAVLSKPIPKAAKGKLITGPSHAAGGTLIEAEGGEVIINKRSVAMFGPLLSAINEAGGGVPFTRPMSDGGYAARSSASKGITIDDMQVAFADAVSNIQVIATIEDIQRSESNYMQIQNRAQFQ